MSVFEETNGVFHDMQISHIWQIYNAILVTISIQILKLL